MSAATVPLTVPRGLAALDAKLPAVFLPHAEVAERFFEFFTVNIRNKNTRRAYYKAVCTFAEWCESWGQRDLAGVRPMCVAAYIEALTGDLANRSLRATGITDYLKRIRKGWGFNAEQNPWISRVVGSVSESSLKHIKINTGVLSTS